MMTPAGNLGDILREWRRRRHFSQLDLALEADISQRHLSFIESGRSAPSRDMLLKLAERLDVPLRDRNPMLLAAGYAPVYQDRALDSRDMTPAREAISTLLACHEPFPALAIDRHWTLVIANRAVDPLLGLVKDRSLLQGPVNVLRLSLHPEGLAPAIENLGQWRSHLLHRLDQQIAASGDSVLADLKSELLTFACASAQGDHRADLSEIAVPLRLVTPQGRLSFYSTTTMFGTPVDITLSELAIETFLPADPQTAALLSRLTPAKTPDI